MSDVVPQGASAADAVLALSWPALRPDDGTPDALYRMNHNGSVDSFREALRQFHAPQQNVVFADVAGNIGFMAPARVPVRRAGNGPHPVPCLRGEFDWIGFVPFEELPSLSTPRAAPLRHATNKNIPATSPPP